MGRKTRYYRTAALLGPTDHRAAVKARRQPIRIRIPWRVVLPLLVVLGLALWVGLGNTWYLMWDDYAVSGASTPHLRREIKIASELLGWHRFLVPRDAVEAAVLAGVPAVKAVSLRCPVLPLPCEIAVEERVPVLTWQVGSESYWVDRDGVFYPERFERPDLPLLRGPLPDADGAYSVLSVYEGLRALAALGVSIDQLEYTATRGLVWTDADGRRIAFGVGPHMTARWRAYETVMAHLAASATTARSIDVRFPEGVTYTQEISW